MTIYSNPYEVINTLQTKNWQRSKFSGYLITATALKISDNQKQRQRAA
jgi:hypothetical protein